MGRDLVGATQPDERGLTPLPTNLSHTPVDLASVADPDNLDEQDFVEYLVHDPVVTDSDAIDRVLALHRDARGRSGIVR